MKLLKYSTLVLLISCSFFLRADYYENFDEMELQVETAADPSVQSKLAMSFFLMGNSIRMYALGEYYDNQQMKKMAREDALQLTYANLDLLRQSYGSAWVDTVEKEILGFWAAVYAFSDSKNIDQEENGRQAMFNSLCAIWMLLKEVVYSQGKDEILPDNSIVDFFNRVTQTIIVKARQGELDQLDNILIINQIDVLAKYVVNFLSLDRS